MLRILETMMPTAVLGIDVEHLPSQITGLERYSQALVFARLHGRPVSQLCLPVVAGQLDVERLRDALFYSADLGLWEHWLRAHLGCQDEPKPAGRPLAATVAICTRDRPEDIRRCLEALMRLPDDGQEVLVIDNCPSTEATRRIVEEFPSVRYVREKRVGLDVARNRALREAQHELIAFIDDDAVPEPGWLRALVRNFEDERVLCVTGLTLPLELETQAQEWFERHCSFQRGFKRKVYDMVRLPPAAAGRVGAGVNMALRRSVVQRVGSFDEVLDAGTPTQSGGDTDMFSRILASGYRIVYDPAAVSWHRHRRAWSALRKTVYGYGVGVYATWTRNLLYDNEFGVLVQAAYWFWTDQLPALIR
jgi:GT2 family glycosyltransferase